MMSEATSSSLRTHPSRLARLKDWGAQTAWIEFAGDYGPLIRNVAMRAGLTHTEADDVMQETLLAVAKKIGEFEHGGHRGSFRAWLLQQTRWRIADQFRKRKSGHAPLPEEQQDLSERITDEMHGGADESPALLAVAWEAEWQRHVFNSALAHVKARVAARQFQLFDLHVLQGMSVTETAQIAGVRVASVYMAKYRVGHLVRREVGRLKKSID